MTAISIDNVIKDLESHNTSGYRYWPLPCPMDDKISALIKTFVHLEPADRATVFGKVKKSFLFLAFSERMAVLAVRENSESRLFDGLIAHVLEDFSHDYRENLLILSLLYHSAVKLGSNPIELFRKAAALASPKSADRLVGFAQNPGSIRSMGYEEITTLDGFDYRRTW